LSPNASARTVSIVSRSMICPSIQSSDWLARYTYIGLYWPYRRSQTETEPVSFEHGPYSLGGWRFWESHKFCGFRDHVAGPTERVRHASVRVDNRLAFISLPLFRSRGP
jgi:hypothetical protein